MDLRLSMLLIYGVMFSSFAFGRVTLRGKDAKYIPLIEDYRWPSSIEVPENNRFTRLRFQLGKKLFEDSTINDKGKSCSSCHAPYQRFKNRPTSNLKQLAKYSIVGVGFRESFIYQGKKVDGLDEFVKKKISDTGKNLDDLQRFKVINLDAKSLLDKLSEAYPMLDNLKEKMAKAISVYLRRATPRATDFDNWMNGSTGVFKNPAKKGFEIFSNNCSSCHSGWLFGGEVKDINHGGKIKTVRIPSLRQIVTRSGKIIWDPKMEVSQLVNSHVKQLNANFGNKYHELNKQELIYLKEFIYGIRVKDLPPF